MKEVFIAYFDLLGFKEFIENNSESEISERLNHIYIELELALSHKNLSMNVSGKAVKPDVSKSIINCINISDTIIYWTNDLEIESFNYLLITSFLLNNSLNLNEFPVRGCIHKGVVNFINGGMLSKNQTIYASLCLYGKGVVDAHNRAESQEWAGTVLDNSIIETLDKSHGTLNSILDPWCIKYRIPYKKNSPFAHQKKDVDEYALRLFDCKYSDLHNISQIEKDISTVFSKDNKRISAQSVQDKIKNTTKFAHFLSSSCPPKKKLHYKSCEKKCFIFLVLFLLIVTWLVYSINLKKCSMSDIK